jgi:hypothetical protein
MKEITPTTKALWALIGTTEDEMVAGLKTASEALRLVDQMIMNAMGNAESAERDAMREMAATREAVGRGVTDLAAGQRFNAMWIKDHAEKVAAAQNRLAAATDRIIELGALRKRLA